MKKVVLILSLVLVAFTINAQFSVPASKVGANCKYVMADSSIYDMNGWQVVDCPDTVNIPINYRAIRVDSVFVVQGYIANTVVARNKITGSLCSFDVFYNNDAIIRVFQNAIVPRHVVPETISKNY